MRLNHDFTKPLHLRTESIHRVTMAWCLSFLLSPAISLPAQAQSPALDFEALGSGFNYYQGQYSLGWRFTAKENMTVTALGFYDDLKNGLGTSHPVGIFDQQTCQLITSTVVNPSDPLTGFFRYHAINPVVLASGRDYYIAALTTAPDPYAVRVTDLTVHPSISFWGFAIYGNTQPTTTLQCPNGPAGQQNFNGDFGPGFLIGDSGGGSGKRSTSLNLFCNRSGSGLETARCSATVADIGAPPRALPTGTIDFVADDGFFPETAGCVPAQTAFSPGVGSCEAVFQVPAGFPIGARFPIEAVYTGNDQFNPSATSHELIQAGCIGDDDGFCSGSASLGFANLPEIVSSFIDLIAGCASSSGPLAQTAFQTQKKPAEKKNAGSCSIAVSTSGNIAKSLSGLDAEAFTTLDEMLTDLPKPKDRNVLAVHELVHQVQTSGVDWTTLKDDPDAIAEKLLELRNKGILKPKGAQQKMAGSSRKLKPFILSLGFRSLNVKSDQQKSMKLKVPRDTSALLDALKQVGIGQLEVSMTLTSKRQGKLPQGISRKESVNELTHLWVR